MSKGEATREAKVLRDKIAGTLLALQLAEELAKSGDINTTRTVHVQRQALYKITCRYVASFPEKRKGAVR